MQSSVPVSHIWFIYVSFIVTDFYFHWLWSLGRVLQWTLVHGRPYDPVHQIRYCNTISKATDKQQGDNGRDFEITRSGLMCKLQDQLHSCGHCIKTFTGSIIRKPGKLLYFWFGSLDRTKKCIQTTCIIYYKHDLCNLPSFIQFWI